MPEDTSSPTQEQLQAVTDRFFDAYADNSTRPTFFLGFFSTSSQVSIQHYSSNCPNPQFHLLRGQNAIRSYFDLLATNWTRSGLRRRISEIDLDARKVVIESSITWEWNISGRSWEEEFIVRIGYDDLLSITSMEIKTISAPETCLMQAKDEDSV